MLDLVWVGQDGTNRMPIFLYRCAEPDCQIKFEAILITQQDRKDVCCPRCSSKKIEQQPTTFSVKFKAPSQLDIKRGACHNPYENLTLHHVRDEHNKPIKVNSRRELEAAEKKYGFVHALSHALTQDAIDAPPQHEAWAGDIARASNYEWKWSRDPEKRAKILASDDVIKVDVGIATSKSETLAGAA